MKAITIQNGQLQYRPDLPEPVPAGDEVVVDVLQAGICETDLQLARGYMGFAGILGHEFIGIATTGRLAGHRVVGEINCNCRQCPRCLSGLGNHCGNRTVVGIDRHDGVFAQQVCIPEHNLHPVPDSVSDDEAVFAEPLAAALQICEQVRMDQSDRVVVLGDGRLAYLSAQAVGNVVDHVTVVGKHDSKLTRFKHRGIQTVKLENGCDEQPFDVVIDCTGSDTGMSLALSLVRPRGTVVMKTTVAGNHNLSLAPIVIDEITVIGSRCGPFAKAVKALESRAIDVSNLITHRYPLDAVHDAMAAAVSPDAFKVVFDVS